MRRIMQALFAPICVVLEVCILIFTAIAGYAGCLAAHNYAVNGTDGGQLVGTILMVAFAAGCGLALLFACRQEYRQRGTAM